MLTGHTGFKGGWLALWLEKLGAKVTGLGLSPDSSCSLYEQANIENSLDSYICDIRDEVELKRIVNEVKPQVVFHLAAQPLVLNSYSDPLNTFSTNVMGTANVLDSFKGVNSIKVAVMITTDKVYKNKEWTYPYRETDELGGYDPYSASKAASEIVISSYQDSYFYNQDLSIASARAGNVIGGGDWSSDRLIPDAVRAWQNSQAIKIRRPESTRPWQHVLEPLAGYLTLAEKLWEKDATSGAYNFGPNSNEVASVRDVIEKAREVFGQGEITFDESSSDCHEAGLLALEVSKSRKILHIEPKWPLNDSIRRTMEWYSKLGQGQNARVLCLNDIEDYEKELNVI